MKKSFLIGAISASAVVVVGGGTFVYAAQVFTPPKQILLKALQHAAAQSPQDAEVSFTASVSGLSLPSSARVQPNVMNQFSNVSLSGNVQFAPDQKEIASQMTLNQPSGNTYTVNAWVTGDQAIVGASDLQPLLEKVIGATGVPASQIPKIPEYLTTDSLQSGQIANFWTQLNNTSSTSNTEKQKAARDILTMLFQAIPSKDITRSGLSTINLSVTKSNLPELLDSEISYLYAHKAEFTEDINTLNISSTAPRLDPSTLFQGETASQVIQKMNDAFQTSDPFESYNLDLTLSKSGLNGPVTAKYDASASLNPAYTNGTSGTFKFSYVMRSEKHVPITLPVVNSQDSMTFQQFVSQP